MSRHRGSVAELARLHGVVPVHRSNDGAICRVGDDTLLEVLGSLGVRISGPGELDAAIERRRLALWQRGVPPVVTTWTPGADGITVWLSDDDARAEMRLRATLESGEAWDGRCGPIRVERTRRGDGRRFVRAVVPIEASVPEGFHEAVFEVGEREYPFCWIVAPRRAHACGGRTVAGFAPLYALRSRRRGDCADFSDWVELAAWAGAVGMRYVGTLPLCAAFLEPPVEPSPYAPVSRLFWNEVYIDFEKLPEFAECAEARAVASTAPEPPAKSEHVDWPEVAERRRRILGLCADRFFEAGRDRSDAAYTAWLERHPEAERFARFRAAGESFGRDWRAWPDDACERQVGRNLGGLRYHRYVQWRAQQQVEETIARMREHGIEPYLDLPLGVHPDGFDAWAHREEFLTDCSTGAPPDPFFTRGQDWGFAPIDPVASRRTGHRYFRACLRHQLSHCGMLRIDHVMGLQRIWCIPHGRSADDGCYVQQPAEDLYAILTLESRRQRCVVVGEDLGTVPLATERALDRHGVLSMHVVQFELSPDNASATLTPPPESLSALNTHDMPPFAAWWNAGDVDDRVDLGLLDADEAADETRHRERSKRALLEALARDGHEVPDRDAASALSAILHRLAASPSKVLTVSLEDLWGETRPQNTPGTVTERHNWQRRMVPTIDAIHSNDALRAEIESIVRTRRGGTDGRPQEAW